MSTGTPTMAVAAKRHLAAVRVRDYVELTKPRIAVMALVTVAVGAVAAAWGPPEPWTLLNTLLGMALVAASGTSLNQWLERGRDARMQRTADRPLPAGRINGAEAALFGIGALAIGLPWLLLTVNLPTALAAFASWLIYVAIYTPLKTVSPSNTVVGAVAGALPILVGWLAMDRPLSLMAWTLFLVVYLWQFPHFMAIAWMYRRQYDAAGMKMLTTVDPTGRRAATQAVWSALVLVPVSLVPCVVAGAGFGYAAWASALGIAYLVAAAHFAQRKDELSARRLLRVSLVYLPGALLGITLLPWIK